MAPDLEAVSSSHGARIPIHLIDAEQEPELVTALGVKATPTLVLYDGSGDAMVLTGRRSRVELVAVVEALISGDGASLRGRKEVVDLALRVGAGSTLVATGLAVAAPVLSVLGGVVLAWAMAGYVRVRMRVLRRRKRSSERDSSAADLRSGR